MMYVNILTNLFFDGYLGEYETFTAKGITDYKTEHENIQNFPVGFFAKYDEKIKVCFRSALAVPANTWLSISSILFLYGFFLHLQILTNISRNI